MSPSSTPLAQDCGRGSGSTDQAAETNTVPMNDAADALSRLLEQLQVTPASGDISQAPSALSSPVANVSTVVAQVSLSPDAVAALTGLLSHLRATPSDHAPSVVPSPSVRAESEKPHKLDLGAGMVIEFLPSQVSRRQPPVYSFTSIDGYKRLFAQWHNTDPTSASVVINGRGIPMRAWGQLYQEKTGVALSGTWRSLKSTWNNWKFLVDEYERLGSSIERFEREYSKDGQMSTYTKILDAIQERRRRRQEADAKAARRYFSDKGGLYGDVAGLRFKYRKTGQWFDCEKDETIAERWNRLLANDDGAAAWARQQRSGV